MNVKDAILARRAYRALEPAEITDEIIKELAIAAQQMCSCFNNQPWRFVFVRSKEALEKVYSGLNKGNEWIHKASLVIAAFSRKENDCVIQEREYYQFDLGLAVSSLILRATELGLVAHPIAGFDPVKIKQVLSIPEDYLLITLVIVGKKSENPEGLSAWQLESEAARPPRLVLENICAVDAFDEKLNVKMERK